MTLIKCSECHHDVSDKARNCPHCGAPIGKKIQCEECGNYIPLHSSVCPYCGFPFWNINKTKQYSNITSESFIIGFNIISCICILQCLFELFTYLEDISSAYLVVSYIFTYIQLIAFFYWFYNICKTIKRINPLFQYNPYWTWLSFLIPVLQFVKPYQIMSSVWEESYNITKRKINCKVLIIWWIAELISCIYFLWIMFSNMINEYYVEPPFLYFISYIFTIFRYFMDMYIIRLYHFQELCFNINN